MLDNNFDHYCPCPEHYCPYPTNRHKGCRVYGLVFLFFFHFSNFCFQGSFFYWYLFLHFLSVFFSFLDVITHFLEGRGVPNTQQQRWWRRDDWLTLSVLNLLSLIFPLSISLFFCFFFYLFSFPFPFYQRLKSPQVASTYPQFLNPFPLLLSLSGHQWSCISDLFAGDELKIERIKEQEMEMEIWKCLVTAPSQEGARWHSGAGVGKRRKRRRWELKDGGPLVAEVGDWELQSKDYCIQWSELKWDGRMVSGGNAGRGRMHVAPSAVNRFTAVCSVVSGGLWAFLSIEGEIEP